MINDYTNNLLAIECPYLHAYFLWCIHYIKIFLFVYSFHLCALNSVLWKFLQFFLIWNLIYLPLKYMKTASSWFWTYSRGRNFKFQIKKIGENSLLGLFFFYRTYYFGKRRHDMKQCTTFKFKKKHLQFGTLIVHL